MEYYFSLASDKLFTQFSIALQMPRMGFIATITPNPLLGEVSCIINSCLVSVLGGASNPGGGENTQQPIFGLQYLTLLIFVLGGQQSRQRRKHSTTNIWTAVLDNYLFFSLCTPPSVHVNQYAAWYTPIVNLIQASYCQQTCRTYTSRLFHPFC